MAEVELDLMEDPAALGSRVQALLLMNPNARFTMERRGETVVFALTSRTD